MTIIEHQEIWNSQLLMKIIIGLISLFLYLVSFFVFEVIRIGKGMFDAKIVVDFLGILIATFAAFAMMRVDNLSRLPLGLLVLIMAMVITGTADLVLNTVDPNREGVRPWIESYRIAIVLFVILVGSLIGKRTAKTQQN
ncbi:MAG: hypothetical protein D6732_08850 [Methanobacteriota archaeon]|nr:MAG: hypothetical protein D6732_08850 [Euryarchaeota archaeon]